MAVFRVHELVGLLFKELNYGDRSRHLLEATKIIMGLLLYVYPNCLLLLVLIFVSESQRQILSGQAFQQRFADFSQQGLNQPSHMINYKSKCHRRCRLYIEHCQIPFLKGRLLSNSLLSCAWYSCCVLQVSFPNH